MAMACGWICGGFGLSSRRCCGCGRGGAISDGVGRAEAVRVFGVGPDLVRNWRCRQEAAGIPGLRSGRPGRVPGERTKLTPAQEAGPGPGRSPTARPRGWRGGRHFVDRRQGPGPWSSGGSAPPSPTGVSAHCCAARGATVQRPDRRASDADPHSQREWTEQTSPDLRKRDRAEGARVMFTDQVGMRLSPWPAAPGTCVGTRRPAPGAATGSGGNAMSAPSPTGTLYFTVFQGSFTARVFIGFLQRLVGHVTTKVHPVLDRHAAHRCTAVRAWAADHAERIKPHFLPSYSPHLNPDELVNADLKRPPADAAITTRQRIQPQARPFFRSIQQRTDPARGHIQAPHPNHTTKTT